MDKTIEFPGDAPVGVFAGRWSYTATGDIAAQFSCEDELCFLIVMAGEVNNESDPKQRELLRQKAAAWLEKIVPYIPPPQPEPVAEPVMEMDGQATLFDMGAVPVNKKKRGRYQ